MDFINMSSYTPNQPFYEYESNRSFGSFSWWQGNQNTTTSVSNMSNLIGNSSLYSSTDPSMATEDYWIRNYILPNEIWSASNIQKGAQRILSDDELEEILIKSFKSNDLDSLL